MKLNLLAALLVALSFNGIKSSPLYGSKPTLISAIRSIEETPNYRLNDDCIPSHYDVHITPYFEGEKAFMFEGKVFIDFKTMKENISHMELHMNTIDIESWFIYDKDGTPVDKQTQIVYDEITDKLKLGITSFFKVGETYKLEIQYWGKMTDDMKGLYRSYFFDSEHKKVWMASSHFEPYSARRAFPCFDEPKFKATFNLRVTAECQYNVFSNTMVQKRNNINETCLTEFEKTPIMSTYLIALIVAPYKINSNKNGTFRILSRETALNMTDYSLDVGDKLVAEFDKYLDYPFSSVPEMKKMDMASIPDFSAGAMENWGLLTYRERNILYDDKEATSLQKQRIGAVIAHEIAHQWFGDLVTCNWFDVIWLNEGFARYFQYYGTLWVEKDWSMEHQFTVEQLQAVFQLDSTEATHPLSNIGKVNTKTEISAMFDNISYNKGAVILRMLKHFMGEQNFQKCLQDYLKKLEFKNAQPEDFFEACTKYNKDVKSFIENWTTKAGYPLIAVKTEPFGYSLSQERYASIEDTHWTVPVTYSTQTDDFHQTLINATFSEKSFNITRKSEDDKYFVLNNQQVGYYRVNYDEDAWMKISKALKSEGFGGIHVLNRAQIVDDLYNLAKDDYISYPLALNILEYMKDESAYEPWLAAFNGLSILARRARKEDEDLFRWQVTDILEKPVKLLKFEKPEKEDHLTTLNRINVMTWACKYGNEECIKKSLEEYEKFYTTEGYLVEPDIREYVYCTAMRENNDLAKFNFLLDRHRNHNAATERGILLQGMGCANNQTFIDLYLDEILSENIRPQDKSTAFGNVYTGNDENVDYAMEYIFKNHVKWAEVFGGYGGVASSLNSLSARFKTDEQEKKLIDFANENKATIGDEAYSSIISGLGVYNKNKIWSKNHMPDIVDFYDRKKNNGVSLSISFSLLFFTLVTLLFNN